MWQCPVWASSSIRLWRPCTTWWVWHHGAWPAAVCWEPRERIPKRLYGQPRCLIVGMLPVSSYGGNSKAQ